MPFGQVLHKPPANALKVPDGHWEQSPFPTEPAALDFPAAHAWHVAFELAPGALLHRPALQSTQSALEDEPIVSLHVPAGHCVDSPNVQNAPATQAAQLAPTTYVPFPHWTQSLAAFEPTGLVVPGEQAVQTMLEALLHRPAGQSCAPEG